LIRLAANFNGEYLSEIGSEPDEDLYVKSRVQLDLSASYVINQRFSLFAEGLNLTNQPFESYFGNKNTVSQREFYSWWDACRIKVRSARN
jgi:outer membrane receptor protein involved in Fe transport